MADTTLPGLFQSGDHASRPAASAVGSGALYACTTHNLIYQSDGSSWTTWWTGAGAADILDFATAETDDTLVLAPDGAGGVEFRAEAGGGGGGITQAYVGYNTVGGSTEQATNDRQIIQKITLANDCLLTDIEVYVQEHAAGFNASSMTFGLWADSAGAPTELLTYGSQMRSFIPDTVSGSSGPARWFGHAIGRWCAAGDYWIGFGATVQAELDFFYDATGTSKWWDKGGNAFVTDAPAASGTTYALNSATKTYSVRANTIR